MSTTPRQGHDPVRMRRIAAYGDVERVGDFWWQIDEKGHRMILIALPIPSGKFCWSEWAIAPLKLSNGASWTWDGDVDAPTLSPSLHAIGLWHGWVRKGMLIEA